MFILCKQSGVLTISCHDREHAPRARDHQVSSGLHFFKKSRALTIRCHDREQAPPARELRWSFFVNSLGCSRSHVTIVSMLLELVIIKCLQDFISSRGLGHSRSDVTIVSKPSQLVTFSTSISKEVWDAHDPMSRS